jgi:hypothetical protein
MSLKEVQADLAVIEECLRMSVEMTWYKPAMLNSLKDRLEKGRTLTQGQKVTLRNALILIEKNYYKDK